MNYPKVFHFAREVFFKRHYSESRNDYKRRKNFIQSFFDEYFEKFSSDKEWLKNELSNRFYTFNTNN